MRISPLLPDPGQPVCRSDGLLVYWSTSPPVYRSDSPPVRHAANRWPRFCLSSHSCMLVLFSQHTSANHSAFEQSAAALLVLIYLPLSNPLSPELDLRAAWVLPACVCVCVCVIQRLSGCFSVYCCLLAARFICIQFLFLVFKEHEYNIYDINFV